MRFQPHSKSKIGIPLCRMITLLVVCPFLKNDVLNLASYFVACGYLEDNGVFYVSLEDNEGKTYLVTDETRQLANLVINPDPSFFKVDLVSDDVLFNPVTSKTELCSDVDGMPWRGIKENLEALIHLFVQGLSMSNGIIAHMTASISPCLCYLLCIF